MKPPYFFLLSLLFCVQNRVCAQADELAKILAMKDDTIKVQQLTTYAPKVVHKDQSLALKASTALLKISRDLAYDKGIATGYSFLAFIDLERGKHAAADELYKKAIIYYKRANDDRGVAKCLGNMADIYETSGDGTKAVDVRLQAVAILEKLLQSPNAAKASIMHSLAIQYNNFAATYANLFFNNEKAFQLLRKAETICRQNNDTAQLVDVLSNISGSFIEAKKPVEALAAAEEVLGLSRATQDNYHLSSAYQIYGHSLYALGKIDTAVIVLRQALQYAKASASDHRIFKAVHTLAMALSKKGEYKEVIDLLEPAYHGIAQDGALKYKSNLEDELSKAYFALGNYKAAYMHLDNRYKLQDSVIQLSSNQIIAEKEIKYQTAQKEKLLAQKELQLQKSRQHAVLGLVASVIALLVAALIFLQYRNKRRLHQSQLQSLQQEKEIQLLQAVMQGEEKERSRIAKDLHDGVAGMLAAVKMHLSNSKSETEVASQAKAIELLDEATAEVRKTSHNLMPEVLLHHGLDKALQRYCTNISSASLQVHYYFVGDDQRFVASFELSVYRIVQELLNNIFKHSKATEATVQLSIRDSLLSLSVEDNGVGFTKSSGQPTGMGLELLKRRIRALNGDMELSSENGGVYAYLEFSTQGLQKTNTDTAVTAN